jgi:hypothetical protein
MTRAKAKKNYGGLNVADIEAAMLSPARCRSKKIPGRRREKKKKRMPVFSN